jgi:cyclic pyranopterin phosphate synthase
VLDVSRKANTLRTSVAQAELRLSPKTLDLIRSNAVPKGDPLAVARVAAIQAAKRTSEIVPYCHPVPLDFVGVDFELRDEGIVITCTAKAIHRTGVEMEALTAASVAALTIYDMVKMLDDSMEIVGVRLVSKTGGKSDFADRRETPLRAAVLVMSDSIAEGKKEDHSGRLIAARLKEEGLEVVDYRIIPDEVDVIREALLRYADESRVDLVITTGGTGLGPRDRTPEVMAELIEREVPGIPEATRAFGQARTPYAMLSRGKAGIRGSTLIINLPGSRKGAAESLDALFPGLLHAFHMLRGEGHG